ncbi:MAG: hypothetical protein JWL85_905 [Candidatus Saccharibacteria bacterium]|nr:hypothetical protein [Candidatus Saccharibacteria bacterium]
MSEYDPKLGLVELLERPNYDGFFRISKLGAGLLERAAEMIGMEGAVLEPDPRLIKDFDLEGYEHLLCIPGLRSPRLTEEEEVPARQVAKAALRLAEEEGVEVVNPGWFEALPRLGSVLDIKVSMLGLNPANYGWTPYTHYNAPDNRMVQEHAAEGIVAFSRTRDADDLRSVQEALLQHARKYRGWWAVLPRQVTEINSAQYLHDQPGDEKGALHQTAKALFSPWK